MLKTEQPSNIKPDTWYKEYIAKHEEIIYSNHKKLIEENEVSLNAQIEGLKESDKFVDVYNLLNKYLSPFFSLENRLYVKMRKDDKKYKQSTEYIRDQRKLERVKKILYHKIPLGVTKEQFERYYALDNSCYSDICILFEANSLQENLILIKELKDRLISLKELPDINKIKSYDPLSWERCVLFDRFRLDHCLKAVNQGYLVSYQLFELWDNIGNYEYDIYCEEKQNHPESIEDLDFRDFACNENGVFELIKRNEKWHDIDRDLSIYQERKTGKYLQELSTNFGIKETAISMVLKKVQGAINYYQGKLFEDFVEKRLKEPGLFEKVVKEAGKGEADILAYTKDGEMLYIYSLKNIKINRNPYWLTKEELRPELERALLQKLDYKIHLILLVFDNHNNKVKQFQIDYDNPKNIDIAGASHV